MRAVKSSMPMQTVKDILSPEEESFINSAKADRAENKQALDRPVILSASQSAGTSSRQSDGRPAVQTDIHPVSRSVSRSDAQPYVHPVSRTVVQPVKKPVSIDSARFCDPAYALTHRQGMVLTYLLQQDGITQRTAISAETGVPFGTVKDALAILAKRGFISKPGYFVNGQFRGISFIVNQAMCDDFIQKRGHEFNFTINQTVIQPLNQPDGQTVVHPPGRSDGQKVPCFSSSSENHPTTSESEILNLEDPELIYWRDEGLNQKRLTQWIRETGITPDQLDISLRYARYDILKRGDIEKPLNWVYHEIKRHGLYLKPTGYKSMLEIRLEEERAALHEKRRQTQELAELRLQQEEATLELEFQTFLTYPESPEYKEIFTGLSDFEKKMRGKVLEVSLRRVFSQRRGYGTPE